MGIGTKTANESETGLAQFSMYCVQLEGVFASELVAIHETEGIPALHRLGGAMRVVRHPGTRSPRPPLGTTHPQLRHLLIFSVPKLTSCEGHGPFVSRPVLEFLRVSILSKPRSRGRSRPPPFLVLADAFNPAQRTESASAGVSREVVFIAGPEPQAGHGREARGGVPMPT